MSGMNGYECGMYDAWETARKIVYDGLRYEAIVKIFGTANLETIFTENTAAEAIEKIRKYEASRLIRGDIIKKKAGEEVGVITKITTDYKYCIVMLSDGDSVPWSLDDVIKIGHMDMITTITDSLEKCGKAKGDLQ